MVDDVQLAGIRIPDEDVRELAGLVDEPLSARLLTALGREVVILGLSILEREHVLRALDDPPTDALAQLRGVLLDEHVQRANSGLV